MTLELIVIGLGKRVTECALPAIAAAGGDALVRKIFARSARTETINGQAIEVHAIGDMAPTDLEGNPTVYLCVPKTEIGTVLQQLDKLHPENADLLIETPVLRLRDFKHAALLCRWRNVSVADGR